MRSRLQRSVACLVLLFGLAQAQIVIPRFGIRGDVPEPVIVAFMASFRQQLERATGLGIREGDLIPPGIAGSLDPGLFGALLQELGEGGYGISGQISGRSQDDGQREYSVNLLVVDVQTQRSSDLLSRSFSTATLREAARDLAREVQRFIIPEGVLPAGSAMLFIMSQPGEAEVFINGVYVGRTSELEPLYVAPGRYDIEIRKEGFLPWFDTVTVTDNRTEFPSARLTPTTGGSIQVRSRPKAEVYLNDRYVGTSPLTIQASPGQQTLRLERPGFESQRLTVMVRDFRVTQVQEDLTPASSNLLFWDVPSGALVYINGLLRSQPFVSGLRPGEHFVELRTVGETARFRIHVPTSGVFEIDFENQALKPFRP